MMSSMLTWMALAWHVAPLYDLQPELISAIIFVESGGKTDAISPAGAVGLMQVMPREAGECFADRPSKRELLDPLVNISWGCRILKSYIDMYGGDVKRGVMAYYAGPGNIPLSDEVTHAGAKHYLDLVLTALNRLFSKHNL